jgi:NAD(P)-dependent dehydrogenase (short-subunit alcohol dehydrogenase family)
MVTGANSGIGKETALGLSRMGATVVMVCRDQGRGEAALSEIAARSNSQHVELMIADLSSQRSIRRLATEYREKHDRLHVLVNNAGRIIGKRTVTDDGLETTFALNHLGYFLLTVSLLDLLKAGAPARVVNVASSSHYSAHIEFSDLQSERSYRGFRGYGRSKLANILFTFELARRLEGTNVTANCVQPGTVRTRLGHDAGGLLGLGIRLYRPFMGSAKKGAETPIFLASSPEVEAVNGRYFSDKRQIRSSRESRDETVARRLWEVSLELTSSSE